MSSSSSPTRLPPGFETRRIGRRTLHFRSTEESRLDAVGFLSGTPAEAAVGAVGGGRAPHALYSYSDETTNPTRVVWKHCRRGGAIAPLLGDRYFRTDRFIEELHAVARAREAGVAVADLLAVAMTRRHGAHRVELIVEAIEGAEDAAAFFTASRPAAERRAGCAAVAKTLRHFHRVGLHHGDLNLRNILLSPTEPGWRATLIDLDPAPASRREGRTAQGNLQRLLRSWRKFRARDEAPLSAPERWRFLLEYCGGDRAAARRWWNDLAAKGGGR